MTLTFLAYLVYARAVIIQPVKIPGAAIMTKF
jgi:hypothetical protein